LDEAFVKIGGEEYYLWRAMDQDGEVVDVYLQSRRDARATKRFFQRFLKRSGVPKEVVTDKLRSYGVVHRSLIPSTHHNSLITEQDFPINPLEFENGSCADSNRLGRHNDFWKVTLPSTICLIFTDIRFADDISSCLGFDHSRPGISITAS